MIIINCSIYATTATAAAATEGYNEWSPLVYGCCALYGPFTAPAANALSGTGNNIIALA